MMRSVFFIFVIFLLPLFGVHAQSPEKNANLQFKTENTAPGLVETHPQREVKISDLTWKGYFAIALFVLTFIALMLEVRSPDITLLISAGILVIVGILTPKQFLEGFANPILVTIAMLCVIMRALEINGILDIVGRKILSTSKHVGTQLISYMFPVSLASAFLNNTPIVLLMAPIIRRWSLENSCVPSKYLIPLSYAAIFGGMCTLIGTSTNIIVFGLLRTHSVASEFTFFELAKAGIPLGIIGTLYVIFIGRHFLPVRQDPASALTEEAREFTAEFLVQEECPLIGKTIKETAKKYFREDMLIQIERGSEIIDSPSQELVIFLGDRLVFAGDVNKIVQLHTIKGLQSQADPHFELDPGSSHFTEVVLSNTSWLIGKTPKSINFRTNYGASILAIYRQGSRVTGNVRDTVLLPGDTLMLLSGETWHGADYYNKDFYNIRHAEKLSIYHPVRASIVIGALFAMVAAVMLHIPIMVASLTVAFFLIFTGNISIRQAQKSISWNVLLLIASAFAFAKAMVITGVANVFAEFLLSVVGTDPYMLTGGILLITIITTELLTNNAAALILFPIAVQTAFLAGYTSDMAVKTIGITIAIGCSCCFAIPTGYQTHMLVYGPGGYKFKDFLKIGLPLDLIFLIVGTLLIPTIWSLSPSS